MVCLAFLARLVNSAALCDAVIVALPNYAGVCWEGQDTLDRLSIAC